MMLKLEIVKCKTGGYFIKPSYYISYHRILINEESISQIRNIGWFFIKDYPKKIEEIKNSMDIEKYTTSSSVLKSEITVKEYIELENSLQEFYDPIGTTVEKKENIEFEIEKEWGDEVLEIKGVNYLEVSLYHKISMPKEEWHNLPCKFNKDYAWKYFISELLNQIDRNKIKANIYENSGEISLYSINKISSRKYKIMDIYKKDLPEFVGENFLDLCNKVSDLVKKIIDPYNKDIVTCPTCLGKSFITEEKAGDKVVFNDVINEIGMKIGKWENMVKKGDQQFFDKKLKELVLDMKDKYEGTLTVKKGGIK